jgi:hypothetical protein
VEKKLDFCASAGKLLSIKLSPSSNCEELISVAIIT